MQFAIGGRKQHRQEDVAFAHAADTQCTITGRHHGHWPSSREHPGSMQAGSAPIWTP